VLGAATEFVVAPTNASIFSALDNVALMGAERTNADLLNRLDGISYGLDSAGDELLAVDGVESASKAGVWERNTGADYRLSGDSQAAGYSAWGGGVMAGLDRHWGKTTAGFAFGDSYSKVAVSDGESGTIESPSVALYGGIDLGALRIDGDLGYAYECFTSSRTIASVGENATANHNGQEFNGAIQAGLPLVWGGVNVLPTLGLQAADLDGAKLSESGAGANDLAVDAQNSGSLRPTVGVSAGRNFKIGGWSLCPDLNAGWTTEVAKQDEDRSVSANGADFSVAGLQAAASQVSVGGGFTAQLYGSFALTADYKAVLPTGNLTEQTGSLGLRYQFMGQSTSAPTPQTVEIPTAKQLSETAAAAQPVVEDLVAKYLAELRSAQYPNADQSARQIQQMAKGAARLMGQLRAEFVEPALMVNADDRVVEILKTMKSLNPHSAYVEEALGTMAWHAGHYDEARVHFKEAARLDPRMDYLNQWCDEQAPLR